MLLLAVTSLLTAQLLAGTPAPAAPAAPSPALLGKRALEILAVAMGDKDSEVRAAAAQAWGDLNNPIPQVLKLLQNGLRDRNAYVRIESAYSLHVLGDDTGVAFLERIVRSSSATLESPDPAEELKLRARAKTRVRAIERLSEIGGEKAVSLFEKTLKDPSDIVRDATFIALAKMDLGEEFSTPFLAAIHADDEGSRAAAVRALAKIGSGPAIGALIEAAGDPAVSVRQEAMRALAGFSGPETVRLLAKGAKDRDLRVQETALSGLAHIPDGDTSPLLREILQKSEASVVTKLKCMAGLSRRGDRVELGLAEEAVKQKDPDLRALALDVFDAVSGEKSNQALSRMMETDPDGRLRVRAAAILVRHLKRQGGGQ